MITDQVRGVLTGSKVDGLVLRLPDVQLDRPTYAAVNKVLEAVGGKWDRKLKGHVFKTDPTEKLAEVLGTGVVPPKNPHAFFATPPEVVGMLLNDVSVYDGMRVLEPEAGEGAILQGLHKAAYAAMVTLDVTAIELDPDRAALLPALASNVVVGDFLDWTTGETFDLIVMNPPFTSPKDALAYINHIMHAWGLLRPGGRLHAVCPSGFTFRDDKRCAQFRTFVQVHATDKDMPWLKVPSGAFKESGTGVETVIVKLTL